MPNVPVYFENRTIKRCKTCGYLLPVSCFTKSKKRTTSSGEIIQEHLGSCKECSYINQVRRKSIRDNSYINHKLLRLDFLVKHGEEIFHCKKCNNDFKKKDCTIRFSICKNHITPSCYCKQCENQQILKKIETVGY